MGWIHSYLKSVSNLIVNLPNIISFTNFAFLWAMVYFSFLQFEKRKSPMELRFQRIAFIGALGGGIGLMLYGVPFFLMILLDQGSLISGIIGTATLVVVLILFGATLGVPIAFLHVGILKAYRQLRSK